MKALRPVWDIWVRLGHWLIVAGVVFQQISGKELELIDAHATVGILLCGWVLFRVTWGFTGPRFARFSSFPPPSPKAALNSISLLLRKEPERGPGHSAIGGIAVYLMITLIGLTALTGMTSSDDIFFFWTSRAPRLRGHSGSSKSRAYGTQRAGLDYRHCPCGSSPLASNCNKRAADPRNDHGIKIRARRTNRSSTPILKNDRYSWIFYFYSLRRRSLRTTWRLSRVVIFHQ